jgi:G3E family GTPase
MPGLILTVWSLVGFFVGPLHWFHKSNPSQRKVLPSCDNPIDSHSIKISAVTSAAASSIGSIIIMSVEDEKKSCDPDLPIPVTVLSGFLGSGKTTLMKHILESKDHNLKVAVIVNDMAELNIDVALIRGSVVQAEREIISLQNGCICCTLRGDLVREISRIRASREFDYVLVESTGIAEPQAVAQAFLFDPNTAQLATSEEMMLWKQARLDTCVTVIDAHSFADQVSTLQQFGEKYTDGLNQSTPEGLKEGERPISDLLIEQVEFANVILLNKMDLVSEEEKVETERLIRTLNPVAKLVRTEYSQVDLKEILNTGIFDMKVTSSSAGWLQSVQNQTAQQDQEGHTTNSEADEYGVTSFVYRARTPFHPTRIGVWITSILHSPSEWKGLSNEQRQMKSDPKFQLMQENYGTILRAKGFCWLASHDSFMMGISQSGRIGTLHPIMPWFAMIPKEQWAVKEGSKDYDMIQSKFVEPYGDRRQEMVFIGNNLKVEAIRQQLDSCLLTTKEMEVYQRATASKQ